MCTPSLSFMSIDNPYRASSVGFLPGISGFPQQYSSANVAKDAWQHI